MTLFNIPSARRFYERVLTCQGPVYRANGSHSPRDLKSEAEYLISSGIAGYMGGIDRLEISVENPRDAQMLLRYTAEMCC